MDIQAPLTVDQYRILSDMVLNHKRYYLNEVDSETLKILWELDELRLVCQQWNAEDAHPHFCWMYRAKDRVVVAAQQSQTA